MNKEEMSEIQENVSQFVLGLFSVSSLVLKALSLIDSFKSRKKKDVEKITELVEEKDIER